MANPRLFEMMTKMVCAMIDILHEMRHARQDAISYRNRVRDLEAEVEQLTQVRDQAINRITDLETQFDVLQHHTHLLHGRLFALEGEVVGLQNQLNPLGPKMEEDEEEEDPQKPIDIEEEDPVILDGEMVEDPPIPLNIDEEVEADRKMLAYSPDHLD